MQVGESMKCIDGLAFTAWGGIMFSFLGWAPVAPCDPEGKRACTNPCGLVLGRGGHPPRVAPLVSRNPPSTTRETAPDLS